MLPPPPPAHATILYLYILKRVTHHGDQHVDEHDCDDHLIHGEHEDAHLVHHGDAVSTTLPYKIGHQIMEACQSFLTGYRDVLSRYKKYSDPLNFA